MADSKSRNISNLPIAIPDVPDAPTVSATNVGTSRAFNNGAATVSITQGTGGLPTSYSITTTPTTSTTAGVSGANTITGLASATSYTVSVTATNSAATSAATTTGAFTATTVPQAPTIGTFTDGGTGTTGTLSFTAGATGGSSITAYKYSTDGVNYITASGTTSPLSITGLTPATYTFRLRATNANGDSADSGTVSGTVIQPTAFESIASATGTGSSGTITFSSIPGTYQHLQIRGIMKSTSTSTGSLILGIQVNNDSSNIYADHKLEGNGSTVTARNNAGSNPIQVSSAVPTSAANFSTHLAAVIIDLHDYASTSKTKTFRIFEGYDLNRSTAPVGFLNLGSGLWNSTSAVTSISLTVTGSWTTDTTFALYGIKGA